MTQRIHCEDLIGARVRDASGRERGRVVDLEVRPKEDWRVSALILGRFSFLDRFDLLRHIPYRLGGLGEHEERIPWEQVEAFADRTLRLRPEERTK